MRRKYNFPVVIGTDPQGHYLATFQDFPEALTEGRSLREALSCAVDALEEAVAARISDKEEIPASTSSDEQQVELPILTSMKAALYEAMRQRKVSNVELAKALGIDEKAVRRYLDPRHATKVEALSKALAHLGIRASVRFSEESGADRVQMP